MTRRLVILAASTVLACTEAATWPAPVNGHPTFSVSAINLRLEDSMAVLVSAQPDSITPLALFVRDTTVAHLNELGTVHARALGATYLVASVASRLDSIPVVVGVRFVALSSGGLDHVCGITDDDQALCWGSNQFGKLGIGAAQSAALPTPVTDLARWRRVAAGNSHTCWLDDVGQPWCQGGGSMTTPIGAGAGTNVPVHIATAQTFVTIRSGAGSSCGLTASGALWCWGANTYGEAGTGTPGSPIAVPVHAQAAYTFVDFDLGDHNGTCGIVEDGTALCWGHNDLYQLGRDPLQHALPEAAPISGNHGWRSVRLGLAGGCGVTLAYHGYCWGSYPHADGDSTAIRTSVPRRVAGNQQWQLIEVGNSTACGLTTEGEAWCWGSLPTDSGGFQSHRIPHRIPTELRFVSLTVTGGSAACGLSWQGEAWCWGSGTLGDRAGETRSAIPVRVANQLLP